MLHKLWLLSTEYDVQELQDDYLYKHAHEVQTLRELFIIHFEEIVQDTIQYTFNQATAKQV